MDKTNQTSFQLIAALALASHAPTLRQPTTKPLTTQSDSDLQHRRTPTDPHPHLDDPIFESALTSIKLAGLQPHSALKSSHVQLAIQTACHTMRQPEFRARARNSNQEWHSTRRPASLPIAPSPTVVVPTTTTTTAPYSN